MLQRDPDMAVSFAPNPAQKNTQVLFDADDDSVIQLSVFNSNGQRVRLVSHVATTGFNAVPLNLEGLAAGIYLVRISSVDGDKTAKLLVAPPDY